MKGHGKYQNFCDTPNLEKQVSCGTRTVFHDGIQGWVPNNLESLHPVSGDGCVAGRINTEKDHPAHRVCSDWGKSNIYKKP